MKTIKFDTLREAIEFLEKGFAKRIDFDVEVEGVAKYKARMYKTTENVIRVDLMKQNE